MSSLNELHTFGLFGFKKCCFCRDEQKMVLSEEHYMYEDDERGLRVRRDTSIRKVMQSFRFDHEYD